MSSGKICHLQLGILCILFLFIFYLRTIAQTVEEGHYVMGKQVEISNEFSGYFRISHDFERDEIPLKVRIGQIFENNFEFL